MPDTVFLYQPQFIGFGLLGTNFGQLGTLYWWHDVGRIERAYHVLSIGSCTASKANGDAFIFPERCFGKAVSPIFGGPHHHIAHTGSEKGSPAIVGELVHGRVILGIIVYLKFHFGLINGFSCGIHHHEINASRWRVVANEVYFGVIVGAKHHLFGSTIIAEGFGVHKHGTRGRQVKPSQVKHRLGFARS